MQRSPCVDPAQGRAHLEALRDAGAQVLRALQVPAVLRHDVRAQALQLQHSIRQKRCQ